MKQKLFVFVLGFLLLIFNFRSMAQCAMCNATAESSLDSGSTAAKGLNSGVLYLLAMPFLFAAFFLFLYYKRKKIISQMGIEEDY